MISSDAHQPARSPKGSQPRGVNVNPIWTKVIVDAVRDSMTKKCPHCKKAASYPRKQPGQFYNCKRCGHRFKEKGQ